MMFLPSFFVLYRLRNNNNTVTFCACFFFATAVPDLGLVQTCKMRQKRTETQENRLRTMLEGSCRPNELLLLKIPHFSFVTFHKIKMAIIVGQHLVSAIDCWTSSSGDFLLLHLLLPD